MASLFQTVYQDRLAGVLTCFDRVILKGHLNGLYPSGSFKAFLDSQRVRLVDLADYVSQVSADIKAHAQELAAKSGRPYEYVPEAMTKARGHSEEDFVRKIAARDGVNQGLVAVLATVERCRSFGVRGNRASHRVEVVRQARKWAIRVCHERVEGRPQVAGEAIGSDAAPVMGVTFRSRPAGGGAEMAPQGAPVKNR